MARGKSSKSKSAGGQRPETREERKLRLEKQEEAREQCFKLLPYAGGLIFLLMIIFAIWVRTVPPRPVRLPGENVGVNPEKLKAQFDRRMQQQESFKQQRQEQTQEQTNVEATETTEPEAIIPQQVVTDEQASNEDQVTVEGDLVDHPEATEQATQVLDRNEEDMQAEEVVSNEDVEEDVPDSDLDDAAPDESEQPAETESDEAAAFDEHLDEHANENDIPAMDEEAQQFTEDEEQHTGTHEGGDEEQHDEQQEEVFDGEQRVEEPLQEDHSQEEL